MPLGGTVLFVLQGHLVFYFIIVLKRSEQKEYKYKKRKCKKANYIGQGPLSIIIIQYYHYYTIQFIQLTNSIQFIETGRRKKGELNSIQ